MVLERDKREVRERKRKERKPQTKRQNKRKWSENEKDFFFSFFFSFFLASSTTPFLHLLLFEGNPKLPMPAFKGKTGYIELDFSFSTMFKPATFNALFFNFENLSMQCMWVARYAGFWKDYAECFAYLFEPKSNCAQAWFMGEPIFMASVDAACMCDWFEW